MITVLDPPVAKFGFGAPDCETQAVTFSDSSVATMGTLTTWTWDFGDGTPVVIRNNNLPFTHVFSSWGNYNVKLHVTTNNGCLSADKMISVHINPLPRPGFTFNGSLCIPAANAQFANTSSIPDGTQNSFTYLWDFGEPASGLNNSSTSINPAHWYSSVGPFNVRLSVTSGANCSHDTSILLNIIHPEPKANFAFGKPSVCIGDAVVMTDLSNAAGGIITGWNWNLGDGSLRNVPTFGYTYTTDNTYYVSLYVVNSFGCNSDTLTKPFTVYPYPVVSAGPDKFVLEGGTVALTPSASGNNLQYLWTPNLYLQNNANTILSPIVMGVTDITYTFSVTARGNCTASDKVFVKVLKFPVIPNTFTPNNDGINDTWAISYLSSYPDNYVQVFTRTGQLVFESKGYIKPWDGTFKGKPLPMDTYYYIIEPGSGRVPVSGYVTIVK